MLQPLTCVEICAGAGGQALGLAMAGFVHVALVEYEKDYCDVLKQNRPEWNVICADVHDFDGRPYKGVDLLAGGVPCPPFSVAGKQLGQDDERDLFPEAIRLIREIRPRAVMLENVRGFLDPGFEEYRNRIFTSIQQLGYVTQIKLLNASDYGVPQLRPRVVIIGIRKDQVGVFTYPEETPNNTPSVGKTLYDLMAQNGWKGAKQWAEHADRIAPTLVGGSKKHGGPDLGPTRAKNAWAELGVDGKGIANEAPINDTYKKTLLLSAASYFETVIITAIHDFVNNKTRQNEAVVAFLDNKAVKRQYHTFFNWDANNANQFFGLFGDTFKRAAREKIQENDLAVSEAAFMTIGRERNRLVHQNFIESQVNNTFDEIYSKYENACGFVDLIVELLQ